MTSADVVSLVAFVIGVGGIVAVIHGLCRGDRW